MDPALRRSAAHKPSTLVGQPDPPIRKTSRGDGGAITPRYLPRSPGVSPLLHDESPSCPPSRAWPSLSRAEAALADTARICGQPTVRHPRCAGPLLSFRAQYGGVRVRGPASRGNQGRHPLPPGERWPTSSLISLSRWTSTERPVPVRSDGCLPGRWRRPTAGAAGCRSSSRARLLSVSGDARMQREAIARPGPRWGQTRDALRAGWTL
jgi:hypothetical protein